MEALIADNTVLLANRDIAPAGTPGWATDGVPGSVPATQDAAWHDNMMTQEMINIVLQAGLALDKTNWSQLMQGILAMRRFTSTGSANALAITLPVALPAPASIQDGTELTIVPNASNTSAAILALNGGSATAITYPDGSALSGGEIVNGFPIRIMKMGGGTPKWWYLGSSYPAITFGGYAQTVAGSYNITIPAGCRCVYVDALWGGGGGGGGANSTGDAGSGGGSGEFRASYGGIATTPNSVVNIVVGAKGAGGIAAGGDGGNGADSTIAFNGGPVIIRAKAGAQGHGSNGAGINGASGGGGSAGGLGGDLAIGGDSGGIAITVSSGIIMAPGGIPYLGRWHQAIAPAAGSLVGGGGATPGAGGGGAVNNGGGAVAGGAGADGGVLLKFV